VNGPEKIGIFENPRTYPQRRPEKKHGQDGPIQHARQLAGGFLGKEADLADDRTQTDYEKQRENHGDTLHDDLQEMFLKPDLSKTGFCRN
jgi:hypothetical protein